MEQLALGIDIGGTKIFHALVNSEGEIKGEVKKEATPKTVDEIQNKLKEIINLYANKTKLVGISTAGAVNSDNSAVLGSTGNLADGYSKIDFKNLNSNLNIFIENDANCAAVAEHKTGAAKGFKNAIILTLGTGVGGGIIVNNSLLKGKSGAAGEMHFKMSTEKKRLCTCGAWDCFEIYASGLGLKLTYKDIKGAEISTYDIVSLAQKGDACANTAIKKWCEYIAMGILGLNNIFDTDVFVLSGSMAQFADIEFIEEYVNKYTLTSKTSVKQAKAGNYAGLLGAVFVAFEKYKSLS